jgi:hypothetical protein
MAKIDPMVLEAINKIGERLSKLTGSSPSLIIEEEGLTIEAYFKVPTKETGEELSAETRRKFEELLRVVSIDYLFSGKARRITIETERDTGKLLIEFHPIHKIIETLHQ